MLCATQRTGSTMVFDDLRNVLGQSRADGELLYATIVRDRTRRKWEEVWPEIRSASSVSGTAINKVMFHYVGYISAHISGIPVERRRPVLEFEPERFEHFHQFFRDAVWVNIERRDVFAQAVSMYLAEATNIWERLREAPDTPQQFSRVVPYDRTMLTGYLRNFLLERQSWQRFFGHFKIQPVQINYEDAVAGYPDYLSELLTRAGMRVQHPIPERRMLRLGDVRNEQFGRMLRDDVLTELYLERAAPR
jgi:LPS sulfotransferase NodH